MPTREWSRRVWVLLHRARFDEALRREIDAHRAMMDDPSRFGRPLRIREASRDAWGWVWIDDLVQDARHAVRSLAAHKAYTAATLTTLALGIGATTAIFTIVSALVLRPLPFMDPDRLVQVYGTSRLAPREAIGYLSTYRRESTSFEMLVGYGVSARYVYDAGESERVMVVQADSDFFPMLGVRPLIGRTFRTGDAAAVAVVSEAFWRRRFNAEPSALGRTLAFDDRVLTVIGVMPQSFQFPYGAASVLPGVATEMRTDIWMPFDPPPPPQRRISTVTGRLKAGVSVESAAGELAAIARRLEETYPQSNTGRGVAIVPLAHAVVAPQLRRVLFLLAGAVGLVLAIVCANVTNLSLARLSARRDELAVRAALGAGRLRLARQFLTESLLLSLAGGACGVALAAWSTERLIPVVAPWIPRAHEVGFDWRVFAFLLATCLLVSATLGLTAALFAHRDDGRSTLRRRLGRTLRPASGRSTSDASQRRVRDGLVSIEVAMAFVLSVAALLLVRELVRLRSVDTGMATANVLTLHLGGDMASRGLARPIEAEVQRFYEIAARVRELQGVRAAGFTQLLPLQHWGWWSNSDDVAIPGRPAASPSFPVELRYVTPGYFEALGIPIRHGRAFTVGDDRTAPTVIVVNEALARRVSGDEDPTGRMTSRGTIIGVVGDVRQIGLDEPAAPEIYYAAAQNWSQLSELGMTLVVSANASPETLVGPIRAAVAQVDPRLAVFDVKTMTEVLAESMAGFTVYLLLIASFAGVALALALIGTYGLVAYRAAARGREFAIRMALGADRVQVAGLIVAQGLRLASLGLAVGLLAVAVATPLLQNLPVRVRPDAATIAPVATLILIVAVAACVVPAVRASSSAGMAMLRNDS